MNTDLLLRRMDELQTNMNAVMALRSEHLQLRDALLFLLPRLGDTIPGIQKDLSEYFSTNHNLSGRVDINMYNVDGYDSKDASTQAQSVFPSAEEEVLKFRDFKLKHAGETCYIIGAGPSSKAFAKSGNEPSFSIGINRGVKTISCTYGITTDEDAFMKHGDSEVIWFLPEYMNERPGVPSKKRTGGGENIVLWKMDTWRDVSMLSQSMDELAESRALFCYSSSAHPAVHLAHYMGAEHVVLVGIDGSLSIDWYAVHKGVTHTLCEMLFPGRHEVYCPPDKVDGTAAQGGK